MNVTKLVLAASLALSPFAATAQTAPAPAPAATPTPTPGRNDYNINQRKNAQQQRIANGVQSGQMTARETGRVEHQEAGINRKSAACGRRITAI